MIRGLQATTFANRNTAPNVHPSPRRCPSLKRLWASRMMTARSNLRGRRHRSSPFGRDLSRAFSERRRKKRAAPRYNIAPTTRIEVIRPAAGGNELVPMRWGLAPGWWKKPLNELPATCNARAETVATKPMFRSAFKSRRCIIPASEFLRVDRRQGREDAALFFLAERRAFGVRRAVGKLARS